MRPATPEAYKLLHDSSLVFSTMESNGMKIDIGYVNKTLKSLQRKIDKNEKELKSDPMWRKWKKRHGTNANLTSRQQLSGILVEEGLIEPELTEKGNLKGDASVLEKIDHPFAKLYLRTEKYRKLESTYFRGILREMSSDNFVRPSFNLNVVTTYRSSCSDPNLQNIPIRDPEIAKYIRNAFIPRKKNRSIVEIDISGAEVRVSVCYNKDPNLLKYVRDPTTDMHRDMASQIYMIKKKDVSKDARYCAKNMFVFPEFYGSYFAQTAPNLWEAIDRMKLSVNGMSMRDHLADKGIHKLGEKQSSYSTGRIKTQDGTFMEHVRTVEKDFWGRRFKVYSEWKKDWFESYLETGGFHTLTGFKIEGIFARNDVINYPVQGSAFHCLLWSLIRMDKKIRKKKIDAKLMCQIHDSSVADVHNDHVENYVYEFLKTIQVELPRAWEWIIVPIEAEAEVSPAGASWFEKQKYTVAI